jgi:hypothetical protein
MIDNLLSQLSVPIIVDCVYDDTEGSEIACRKQVQQFFVIVATRVDIEPRELGHRTHRARARQNE